MNVLRKTTVEVTDGFRVGDQIMINLDKLGVFSATVQKVDGDDALFFFDDCVCDKPMNTGRASKDFYKTTLGKWMNTDLINLFPDEIKAQIVGVEDGRGLRVPYYGEMFGHDTYYNYFTPDDCDQLELMKIRRNRVCSSPDSEYCWYWCMNAWAKSATNFCSVLSDGDAYHYDASNSLGVRPAFILKSPAPYARD